MKRYLSLALITLTFFVSIQTWSQDEKQLNQSVFIEKVIQSFQESIEKKDSTAFKKLFFHEAVPFVGIMSEETEWSIKKDYADFQGLATSTSQAFISDICESEKVHREDFFNVNISTNEFIASVSFDYAYYSGDRMMQWGKEQWNMVLLDNDWLITDVIYSIRFPDVEAFPFAQKD